ncbi:MAG: T9SS type A sorting domain-containing protein, partial [Sphingomonadales bacterium]
LGTAPYTFLWSNGSTAPQLQNVPAGTYTLQVTDNAGCYEIYTTTLVDPFVITFGGVVAPTCPGGSNGQAVVNSSGCPCMFNTCQFLWDNGVSGKTNLSATEGWNTVTITHTNGCVVVDSVFVPFAAPVVNSATLTMVSCYGVANGSIDLDVSLAFAPQTFDWSNGVGQAYNANLSPGTYDVTVTDARPCTATYAYVITEPDLLVSNYNVQSVSCSGLTDGQVNATATGGNGGYTYQIGSLVNTSGQFNNLSAGTYVLMVNDSLGCVASNQSIQIAEPLALTLTLNATLASGAGSQDGTASAAVSGGVSPYQYAWSGPNTQSDSMAVYLDGGWYTVLVTDANGCSISDSVFVDVLGLNNATVTNLEVYPNPSTGLFKLNLAVVQLEVFDLQGRHITHFNDAQEIDLSHLASGTYQLVCTTDKRTQILRVVKQ